MASNLDLETKVIERFVVKTKQNRYLTFIKTKKNRDKFTQELAHFRDLQPGLVEEVKGDAQRFIKDRIRALGKLNDCYLISESLKLDQKRFDIDNALSLTIGYGIGTLIVFGDAEIVYYEAEGPSDRWISKWMKF